MSDVDIIINVATQGAKSITDLSASLRSLNKGLVDLNIPLKKLDAHSQAVAKALGMGARSANDHAKTLKGLITNQKALGAETKRIRTEIGAYRAAIGFAGASNKSFADSARRSVTELKAMDRALRGMRIRAFGSDLRATSTRIQKIGKDAQFVGRSLMINLTAPLTLFARTGFQQLLAVDKELIRLTKVLDNVAMSAEQAQRKLGSGASPKQIQGLISAFNNLNTELTKISSNYGVSKQLIVGLASDFAELGINGHESILAMTELTAQIEKLGAMDISGAQDLTQALYFQSVRAYENTGAFKGMTSAIEREALAVKAATTQMYLFNAIENVTALTLKDLGQAFPEVASMAVSFGLSMTEAAALLAPMKAAGLDVGASANSIKVSLQRALSPTTKNIKILEGLAKSFGEAGDESSAFATAAKTGLTGLQSITEIFDKVKNSKAGAEGAMKLMSNLFEKRQGPRMYLAIEQLSLFNAELNKASRRATSAEGILAGVAEDALRGFNQLNGTALPESINNFRDIGIIARIATGTVGQLVEGYVDASGMQKKLTAADIKSAKEVRKAVADRILLEKQTKGKDLVSEVRTETGRAMIVELAGASNAAQVANAELSESLKSLSVVTERLKNNFKLFAADIMKSAIPILQNLSEKVQSLMDKWNNSTEEFRERVGKVIGAIVAFLAALGPVVLAIGTMQAVTGVLGRAIAVFIPKLATETGAFIGLGKAIRGATASLAAHTAAQNKSYLGAIKNKLFGKTDMRTPADAIKDLTAASKAQFGTGYKPIQKITATREAKILEEQQFKAFQRLNPSTSPEATQKKLFKESQRISKKVATSGAFSLTPKEAAFQAKNALQVASVPTAMSQGATAATPIIARKKQIFDRSDLYARKGIMTDADGSKFFTKSGREISEKRASQLATGQMAGRVGLAKDAAMSGVRDVGVKAKNLGKGFVDALNPVKQYKSAVSGAKGAVAALQAQNSLMGLSAPGMFAKARAGVMGFIKGIKIANTAMKILRMTMIASGIGAILLVIGVAVYAVMKNFDKFKTAAKPALDALSSAFGQIKQAVIEVIRPIFDLFGAFGKGSSAGEAAADGIGSVFAKLAGVIKFVSGVVQNFLYGVVRPIMQGIVNVVMAVVSAFKGNWGDAFNYLIAALGYAGKAFINIWMMIANTGITIIGAMAKGIVKLFMEMLNGIVQLVLLGLRGLINGIEKVIGFIPGVSSALKGANNALKNFGSTVSQGFDKASSSVGKLIDSGTNAAKSGVSKVGQFFTNQLNKATKKGMKSSSGAILNGKKDITDAGKEVGEAGGEAIANAMGDAAGEAGDKAGKAIKDGIKEAAQKLQDYVRDAFKSALEKMIDATAAAMKKQKEAGLKVFDVQLKTLEKLEKAEESLTKTKEYQQNLRKILDDRDLNRANYIRNRALAIYEGRVDDARILDLEQQQTETSSITDETSLNESRRKDLAAENLAALREAITEAKEKAGELFDLQIEAFQKAAADIIKIGPVTIEQYAAMQKELETLANTSSSKMNEDFGVMFENFTTTVADKMPNQVVGAFSTGLDLLVAEARAKYGLGDDADENTIIGVTLGMLTSIGDKMGEGGPAVVEAFGAITTDLHGNFTTAKDAILTDVQTAFLVPFKKAFDEADPTAVFQKAIKEGNLAIIRDFENTLELNKELMDKMVANLDPAIKKWIELKAAIDAANDAASGGGGGGAGFTGNVKNLTNPMGNKTVDSYLTNLALQRTITPIINANTLLQERNMQRRSETVGASIGYTAGYKTGGYIPAPTSQGVPAILHGGEFVINAEAVNRIGIGALQKLNDDRLPKFKKGGPVPGGARTVSDLRKIRNEKYEDNFVQKTIDAVTTPKNLGKVLPFLGNAATSVAKSFNTTAAGLLNVVGSVTEMGKKDKSLNPLTNYARRQEGGRNAPLNPARGLGFKDKSGMFNIADDSYLGVGEAFDVATSFPLLGAFGKTATAALRAGTANAILRKIGAAETGLSLKEVVTPAVSSILKRNVGSTVATQITSQVVKQQFRAQEILNQLPRQLPASPRMLELMPGPTGQQVMPSVPALVERTNGAILLGRPTPGKLPLADLSEYLFHGGPKAENLFGGVINPEFIRGGKLWQAIREANKGELIGRSGQIAMDQPSVLTAGTQVSQGQGVLNAYQSVVDVIANANKYFSDEYVLNHLNKTVDGSIFSDRVISSKYNPRIGKGGQNTYLWRDQVNFAQKWLDDNKEIVARVLRGESHATGVKPSMQTGNRAYESLGGVHLLRVGADLNPSASGWERMKGLAQSGALSFSESPFWGIHKPIASADIVNYQNATEVKEAYKYLIHKMIEDSNQRLPVEIMKEFLLSQKIYNNQITPGARSFIIEELQRTGGQFKNVAEIRELLEKATSKEQMLNIVNNSSQRKNVKGWSQVTDESFDFAIKHINEVIEEFSTPRVMTVQEKRIKDHLDSIIHSGADGLALGVIDKIDNITYREALSSYQDRQFLNQIPEQYHQLFQDALSGVPIHADMQQYRNLFSTLPKIDDILKQSSEISLKRNFSTPVLEQLIDPALEAKKAAFLQAKGMGGSGAAFNNLSEFLSTLGGADGPASRLFIQLRQLTSAQQEKNPGLLGINRVLTELYAGTGSKALGFTSMAKSGSSVDLDVYRRSLMMKSLGYDNNKGIPGIALLSDIPFTKEIKTLLNSNETRSSIGLYEIPAEHLAAVMNILVRQFDQIIEEYGTVLPKDILAFRGLGIPEGASNPLDYFNQIYQPGRATAPSYRSVSLAKHMAQGFTEVTNKIPTVENITIPAGTKALMPGVFGIGPMHERELILPRNMQFLAERIEEKQNLMEVYGKMIKAKAFKTGGYVPGSPSMPFPAILHGGEYVINADAVRNMGVETMRNINQSKFRTPSGVPSYQGKGQATTVSTVNINVDTFIGEEEWFKGMMKSYNVNILPRVQKNAGNETRSFTTYNGLNQ